jgi:glycosyltransferase involved in cell wall biosynthesis
MSLSVVIPAYNEKKTITKMLSMYYDYLKKQNVDFEIIIVPNNCSDNTPDLAKDFSKNKKEVTVINIPYFVGKGGAVLEGFKLASKEYVGFVDADLATPPYAFFDLYKRVGDYDAILASRWIKGAKIDIQQSISRRVASRGFNLLVRTMFGLNVKDTQCGAKLFRRSSINKVTPYLGITRWAFDIDLLFHLRRNGFTMTEIPTVWSEPGDSHLNLKKTVGEMFLASARLRLIYSPFRFIVKVYDMTMGRKG